MEGTDAMKLYHDISAFWRRVRPSAGVTGTLWSRVRGPALRLLVGGGLMVPAAVMMARAPAESDPALVPVPRVLIGAARAPVETDVQTALIVDSARWTDQDVAPAASERETAPNWSDALAAASAEAEPRLSVASLAQEFKIPVRLAAQIHAAATAEKIKPRTAFGLVKAESSF